MFCEPVMKSLTDPVVFILFELFDIMGLPEYLFITGL